MAECIACLSKIVLLSDVISFPLLAIVQPNLTIYTPFFTEKQAGQTKIQILPD
jgi:hypothetical protein